MQNNKTAPLALFVYNRLSKLKKTIEYLSKNLLSKKTTLYIFSDGPKDYEDIKKINNIRKYIRQIKNFRKIIIIENKKNFGLGNSIIRGVNEVFKYHNRVIVLEDDLLTNKFFLTYMNDCLNLFKNNSLVYHINGSNFKYSIKSKHTSEYFLSRVPFSWGWATWKDRWKIFNKENEKLIIKLMNSKKFDYDNSHYFFPQLIANYRGKINSWAIFWYANIFLKKKLCFTPKYTFVVNNGYGTHATHTIKQPLTGKNILSELNRKYSFDKLKHFKKVDTEDKDYKVLYKNYIKKSQSKNLKSIVIVSFFKTFVSLKSFFKLIIS